MSSSDSSASANPQKPEPTPFAIADRLEAMAQALKAISDPIIRRHIIHEMHSLLEEIMPEEK